MVHNLYHNDPYARTVETTVLQTFEEDGKKFISLQDSLFYPQGGGQKGDRGTIAVREQSFTVINTVKDPLASSGQAHCIVEGDIGSVSAGMPAKANLNWDHRYKQMRLHSTVHLHHAVMETIAGQPLKYPMTSELQDDGTAYNRYDGDEITEELAIAAIEKMLGIIKDGSAITTRDDLEKVGYRYWESCGYVIPCGGTHLKDLKEIGAISGDFSRKKGRSKILFQLKD